MGVTVSVCAADEPRSLTTSHPMIVFARLSFSLAGLCGAWMSSEHRDGVAAVVTPLQPHQRSWRRHPLAGSARVARSEDPCHLVKRRSQAVVADIPPQEDLSQPTASSHPVDHPFTLKTRYRRYLSPSTASPSAPNILKHSARRNILAQSTALG